MMEQYCPNYLELPPLVWNTILSYLTSKELRTLRSVCKTTKEYACNSSIRPLWSGIWLTLESDHDFVSAVNSGLPISEFWIKNGEDPSFFQKDNVTGFLKIYGHSITKLKIEHFRCCVSDAERSFYEALPNLQELKIYNLKGCTSYNELFPRLPNSIKNLRVLKFTERGYDSHGCDYDEDEDDILSEDCMTGFWKFCPKLEHLKYGFYGNEETSMKDLFQGTLDFIRQQKQNGHHGLQILDLKNVQVPHDNNFGNVVGEKQLVQFIKSLTELKQSIKIKNFPDYDLNAGREINQLLFSVKPYLQHHLVSIVSFHTWMTLLRQQYDLRETKQIKVINSFFGSALSIPCVIPQWNKLESIKFERDDEMLREYLLAENGHPIPSLLKLTLHPESSRSRLFDPTPETIQRITSRFPCLKILHLVDFQLPNEVLWVLWKALPHLEQLSIKRKTVGDNAFIGEELDAPPVFHQLKNLKKLSLNITGGITDEFFQKVLSQMSLRELYIVSEKPLETVTSKGIQSLKHGQFGKSIELFPFNTWSIKAVSAEEFKALGRKFRNVF